MRPEDFSDGLIEALHQASFDMDPRASIRAVLAAAGVTPQEHQTEQRTRVHQLRDTILQGERLADPAWEALHELVCLAGGGP